ncbi:MAG TPA: O-antigen ligase family protein [Kofleriaceae bacterium]|nr:O-antigen ligase family protein [Kofleriaceae bacterium]
MFALPPIALLTIFILVRPQEFIPLLQRVPFLHVFAVLAVAGYVIDVRLRRLQPIATNTLPWAAGFLVWAVISIAINAPDQLVPRVVELAVLFVLYGTIAHGIQRFRTFQFFATVLAATCTFIAAVCLHQGLAPRQCIGGEEQEGAIEGKPDGRPCVTSEQCRGGDAEAGMEYRCEHVGLFGTYSVEDRVRYRGDLNDPNELALTVSAGGLALLIGFTLRKREAASKLALVGGVAMIGATVYYTQSRGGLVAAMLVPAVYLVWRYGWRVLVAAAPLAAVVLAIGGRSGEAADLSTEMRYDAWASGLDLWHHHPVFGVGPRMFTEHHYMTAHNSYVLALAELGLAGLVLFVAIIYLCMKTLVVGMRALAHVPGTAAAQVWGLALLAAMAGIVFQINTLSFAYHPVLWLFFGLVGAWYGAVRHHRPELVVKLTGLDLVTILGMSLAYALVVLPLFLRAKGMM